MVLIAVHGSATRSVPAERGTVRIDVLLEGDDRAGVLGAVTAVHERLLVDARAAVEAGSAVRWWSSQVLARPERRYAPDGRTHRTVQVVTADVRVEFQDATALASWVATVGADEAVSIGGIDWALTDATAARLQREVRIEAVHDAVARAEAYGAAIGGTAVLLQSLWEAGLRPAVSAVQSGWRLQSMSAQRDGGPELRPADIEVTAEVTADFTTA